MYLLVRFIILKLRDRFYRKPISPSKKELFKKELFKKELLQKRITSKKNYFIYSSFHEVLFY